MRVVTGTDEDSQEMLKVRSGDEAAFRSIFERHAPRLVAFADRFFHNRALAEEAAQEAFLRVWRARGQYRPEAKFTTWLYTIATRVCLKQLRKARSRVAVAEEVESLPGGQDPHQAAMAKRQLERLQVALDRLPPKTRAALWLVRLSGLSYQEAAEVLGMSLPAIKSALFRATEAARQAMEQEA